jgi:lipopolysaccharide biosynthesis glycosyltransferase
MKTMIYQVYVGNPSKLYDACVDSVAEYCEKHGIEHIVQKEPILKIKPDPTRSGRSSEAVNRLGYLPIFEKENAFSYLGQYDKIAIVDSDIFIKKDAPNIFDELTDEHEFAAVAEREMPCSKKYRSKIRKYSEAAFRQLSDVDWLWNDSGAEFYNMGLMLLNCDRFSKRLHGQTAHEFLSRPEFRDFIDGIGYFKWSTDQMLLNWWIKKEKISVKNLDWRWNALYKGIDDIYLKDSYFVHFFLKDHLPEKGENVYEILKNV